MTDAEQKLSQLEVAMGRLCALRDARVAVAQTAISHANREFDRDAVPLGRKINQLRQEIDKAAPVSTPKRKLDKPVALDLNGYDPEWSQEDIDHYLELKRATVGR